MFETLCKEHLAGIRIFHMVDESLIRNTISAGRLEKNTIRRLTAQIGSAFDGGATAVLVTCSSIGPGVPVARQMFDGPIFRIDEAMVAKAVSLGSRVGVLATLGTTLAPTVQLIRDTAAAMQLERQVIDCCCEGAFEAVLAGDGATHDRLVQANLTNLAEQADVVVLAQASMARALGGLSPGRLNIPILTSPELAILQVRDALAVQTRA